MNKLMLTGAILQMHNGIQNSNGFASALDLGAVGSHNGGIADSVFDFAQTRASTRTELGSGSKQGGVIRIPIEKTLI